MKKWYEEGQLVVRAEVNYCYYGAVHEWLQETFGSDWHDPRYEKSRSTDTWCQVDFIDENDALLFLLRWA